MEENLVVASLVKSSIQKGHNLLFILHILHQSDGSTFGEGSLHGLTARLEVAEVTALLCS